jgi:hypothetical protein
MIPIETRGLDTIYPAQQLGIERGFVAMQLVPAVEVLELHPQNGNLQSIEVAVKAVHDVPVSCFGAMNPGNLHRLANLRVAGDRHAAIAIGTENFAGEEAEAANIAQADNTVNSLVGDLRPSRPRFFHFV